MKKIGILGGLGPKSTAHFYLNIINECYIKNKIQRPPILIWSIPLKYKIESDLIKKSKGEQNFLPLLLEGAKILEKGGADFIVIPCNTVHIFIKNIRKSVKIPVLSIIEETIDHLQLNKRSELGILATPKTIQQNLYQTILKEKNIYFKCPNKKEQNRLGIIINRILLNKHVQ